MVNEVVTTVEPTGSGTFLGSGLGLADSGAGSRSETSATLTGEGGVPAVSTNPPRAVADSQEGAASRKRRWEWWMMIVSWGFVVAISAFLN